MKKICIFILLSCLFITCMTQSENRSTGTEVQKTRFTGTINDTVLNMAIKDSYNYIKTKVNKEAVLGIVSFITPTQNLSNYCIDSLSKYIVDDKQYKLVDIRNLSFVEQEMKRQLSGNISDATAKRIGQQYGTDFIIIGNISQLGRTKTYRIKITITNIETTEIQGIYYADIRSNDELAQFLPENTTNINKPLVNTTNQDQRIYYFRNITQVQFSNLFDVFSAEAREASLFGNAAVQANLQDGGVSDPYIEYKVISKGVISIKIAGPYYSETYVYGGFDGVDKKIVVNRINVEKSIINAKYGNPDISMFFSK